MAKLTLSMDKEVIAAAKRCARAKGASLSKLVAQYFTKLGTAESHDFLDRFYEELEGRGFGSSHENDDALKRRHANTKYR